MAERCPETRGGSQCIAAAGHIGPHAISLAHVDQRLPWPPPRLAPGDRKRGDRCTWISPEGLEYPATVVTVVEPTELQDHERWQIRMDSSNAIYSVRPEECEAEGDADRRRQPVEQAGPEPAQAPTPDFGPLGRWTPRIPGTLVEQPERFKAGDRITGQRVTWIDSEGSEHPGIIVDILQQAPLGREPSERWHLRLEGSGEICSVRPDECVRYVWRHTDNPVQASTPGDNPVDRYLGPPAGDKSKPAQTVTNPVEPPWCTPWSARCKARRYTGTRCELKRGHSTDIPHMADGMSLGPPVVRWDDRELGWP